jgi:zinc transporter 1/2/3
MSIHAFFETLAVGLQGSVMSVFSLAAAILVHKWAEGLTLGLLYKKEGFSRNTTVAMIVLQGAMNVLGLLTGSFLMGQGSFVMAFFMSVSAGTFLYISLAEVLQEQLKELTRRKLAMVVIANVFVAGIVWWEKAE